MASLVLPYPDFQPNTIIKSAEVDANNAAIDAWADLVATLDAANIFTVSGTAIKIKPAVDPAANTKLLAIENAAAAALFSVDIEGDAALAGLLTLSRSGQQLLLKPSADPAANTLLFEVQNAAGTSVFSVDLEGDVLAQTLQWQGFQFSQRAVNAPSLQNQTAGQSLYFELYTKNGDGSADVYTRVFGRGVPGDIANRENLFFGFDASGEYRLWVEAGGTGSLRPLLFRMGSTEAFRIKTDGDLQVSRYLKVLNDKYLIGERTIAAGAVFTALVQGDTVDRFALLADGKLEWGPGNAARDVNLYRSAADILKTDDKFHARWFETVGPDPAIIFTERTTNPVGSANKGILYVFDDGAGNQTLKIVFANGTVKTIATDV